MNPKKVNPGLRRQIGRLSNEIPKNSEIDNFGNHYNEEEFVEKDIIEKQDKEAESNHLKAEKEAFAKKRLQELREEIQILTHQRQEEIRQRYQQQKEEQKQKEAQQQKKQNEQPLEMISKSKKGKPFWGKRIKTAQDQSQPETAGKRTSG